MGPIHYISGGVIIGETGKRPTSFDRQGRFDVSGRLPYTRVSSYYGALLDRRSKSRQPPVRFTFNRGEEEESAVQACQRSGLKEGSGDCGGKYKQTTLFRETWLE